MVGAAAAAGVETLEGTVARTRCAAIFGAGVTPALDLEGRKGAQCCGGVRCCCRMCGVKHYLDIGVKELCRASCSEPAAYSPFSSFKHGAVLVVCS